MSELSIEVQKRDTLGKNANRRLRSEGRVPAVVYGGGRDAVAISADSREVERLLRSGSGENTVFLLKLADSDKSRHTMIRELQVDTVTGEMIHVDFYRIMMDQAVDIAVPIELHGTPVGVSTEKGILDFVTREIAVSCLPDKIPNFIEVDVSALHSGQHLEIGDLELPEGVTLKDDPNRVIASVSQPRGPEEDEGEEDDEFLLEKDKDEPEVIGRQDEN